MTHGEGLALVGHAATARQIGAMVDTVVDANPNADRQLIDSLTAIAKLAERLSVDLAAAADT